MIRSSTTPPRTSWAVGYSLLARDGALFTFGQADFLGAPRSLRADAPWVALSATSSATAYVAVAVDGSVAGFGVAEDLTATAHAGTASPIVDIEILPSGSGCRLLDSAGGVFCLGDATYHGSIPGLDPPIASPGAVAMATTPSGRGYWILDRAGGVFAFGDAGFHGSVPGLRLREAPSPPVDFVASVTGDGYCILEADGGLRSFGDAPRADSAVPDRRIAAVAIARGGAGGYVVTDARGLVYPVGAAPLLGSAAAMRLEHPIVDIASVEAAVSAG